MRSRASLKRRSRSIEMESPELQEDSHLSTACIRSLVKQLSSSRSKEPMNPNSSILKVGDSLSQNTPKFSDVLCEAQTQQPLSPQPKKQVRRRLHSTRPYQGRMLNMAEARREIVTALKIHRAAMKANEQHQKQHQHQSSPQQEVPSPPLPAPLEESNKDMKSRRGTRIYPPNSSTTFSYFHNTSLPSMSHSPHYPWAHSTIAEVGIYENLSFSVPNQPPLGLNLKFHEFKDKETTSTNDSSNQSMYFSSSSTSSSSSNSFSSSTTILSPEIPSFSIGHTWASKVPSEDTVQILHPVMDDEDMAEIRSIGEQLDIEWNDRLNSATSAWWCKFLEAMETGSQGREDRTGGEEDGHELFYEAMEIPSWFCDQQQLADCKPDACYLQDPTFPW